MKAPNSTKSPAAPLAPSSDYIAELRAILDHLDTAAIDRIASAVWQGYQAGRTLFIFGNGGSAALASHLACDIGKGTMAREKPPLKVVSLTDNVPLMTAWANDHSYDEIFAQQLRGLAHPGDLALAISGSGNSKNVVRGLETAREMGLQPLALTGFGGGKVKNLCELCLIVPSDCMQHVEDAHLCAAHAIFTAVYRRMHNGN
jgi:D-sedoheptulose 7-phosphate isomerase